MVRRMIVQMVDGGQGKVGSAQNWALGRGQKLVIHSSVAIIAIIYSHLRCRDMLVVQKASEVDSAQHWAVGRGGDEITW